MTSKKHHKRHQKRTQRMRGGWGGWPRLSFVGEPWSANSLSWPGVRASMGQPMPINGITSSNHLANNTSLGVSAYGISAPVPEFYGPGINQATPIYPPINARLLQNGGKRKKNKSIKKKGGSILGGFGSDLKNAWDNLVIGVENIYRGVQGVPQKLNADPYNQPIASKTISISSPNIIDISKIQQNADSKVASLK